MKIGLWGARSDMRGLAYQTQAFAKWLQPTRVMGIDMNHDNLSPYPNDWSPYFKTCAHVDVSPLSEVNEPDARKWMKGLDVIIGAETFYKEEFADWARSEGVPTVLQVNPEFCGWWDQRGRDTPRPDVFIAPTTWRLEHMPGAIHLPFPVDREVFPFRLRTKADHFVHVAGHKAMGDRAGTRMLLGSLGRLRRFNVTIRTQSPLGYSAPSLRSAKLEEVNVTDPRDLYADADVVVLPRRYGGNCLVANEALSSGCPVIMLDRIPESTWGGVYRVPCRLRGHLRTKAGQIPLYEAQAGALAAAIQALQSDPAAIENLSRDADAYAKSISWDTMLPIYHDFLRKVSAGDSIPA